MRNKVLFEKKFDQMERMLTAIEYCISRGEQREGLEEVRRTKDLLENMSTLLENEHQDERY